jgi:DNA-directed RNA polymerase sigma subunit (sigma70/sigma32)
MARRDLERVTKASGKVASAREQLRLAILQARSAGETFDAIGRAAGLSRQRVQQISKGE